MDNNDFFKDFLNDMEAANLQAQGEMSIIDFANRIIFNNDPDFQLYPTQKAILKSFYNEKLTEEERSILDTWVEEERSTWVPDRKYISLVLEAGRRASKCNASSAYIPTTKGEITYGKLYKLLSQGEKVGIITYDINGKIPLKSITYDIKAELNAVEPVYKVTTGLGKTEITNDQHPYLVWDSISPRPTWKKLKDLKVGDHIATSSCVPLFGNVEAPDNFLKAVALSLTAKSSDKANTYRITLRQAEATEVLSSYFNKSEFKVQQFQVTFFTEKFNKLRQIVTADFIGSLSKESLRKLLRYILTYTHTCYNEPSGYLFPEERYFDINIFLNRLEEPIIRAFLRFGINFRLIKGKAYTARLYNDTSVGKLFEEFGWDLKNTEEENKRYYAQCTKEPYLLEDQYIPNVAASLLPTTQACKHTMSLIAKDNNDPYLFELGQGDINWETIRSIEPHGVEQTIALEVAHTHVIGSYVITHNSTMASIIALKEFYDLIIMENPHKHYKMFTGSPIAILVMAQSQAQVKETIFAAIRGYAENSHFFTALKERGDIEILSEEIRCQKKNVAIYAKHTNSKSLVGYTLKCMLLDEVARFETTGEEGKNKAFEIWRNVAAGGAAFGTSFKKVAISSAWEPGDPIEVLFEDAKRDPNTLGFKLTTFQVNLQLIKGVTPVIVSDYTTDFVKARREYEGVRFSKFNAFIDLVNLQKSARGISVIDAQPCEIDIESKAGIRHYAGVDIIRLAENPDPTNLSFIHVDPALKKDSAALAIARPQKEEDKWKIQIDGLLKWEPHTDQKGLKRIVSYIDIEERLDDICPARCVQRVTFDQWNSASFIQKLHSKGIDSQQVSCSREMQFAYYTLFRDLLAHDYIIMPRDSLWTNDAITELSELVLKPNRQIIHPYAGKDLADAIVNAVYQCHQYMVRVGLNISTGLNTGVAGSQRLASVTRLSMGGNKVEIGGAIDRLYKHKGR